ncbi:Uncharacterized protein, contains a von Willebrand factor type A (vWA) domain [Streptomyces zhaozhouensis]|uniref:Uncharacterized protein, contains a von Willebrand factor type A (VWA) domain n=1 Tax=Streptomyces zhaozhouensis TaxID=1300267 RepID=A0A286DT97_9ACTN|nr:VWA domain-containing protein [Streptomyces zhaozhouensis]SOD61868.1 Uncharacterized protein, contains a von Willebrand factor type A (vWA) domain [Streptomyces zhaozhouensis]
MSRTPAGGDPLVAGCGIWLARSAATAPRHTGVVVADRFDLMTWHDTRALASAPRELAEELEARHEGADDLLTDVFLAAYQATRPRLRERGEMDPSRWVNHQVVTALTEAPDLDELRRTTAGDPYAAALAVLALAPELRRMLEHTRQARSLAERAGEAGRSAGDAAAAVADALREAAGAAGERRAVDENGPADGAGAGEANGADGAGAVEGDDADPARDAVRRAVEAAEAAEAASLEAARRAARALEAVAPGVRAATHAATARAVALAREEAALLRAWGVEPAERARMPFDQRLRLAGRLGTSRLARWADLIGRFRRMAEGERAQRVRDTSGELVGVTLGDDLSRVLPSELANLGLPALRAVFAARYAAGELMLYDHQGEAPTGRGAIVACVDTSHSMYTAGPGGVTREAWAKGCALALLDQARHARRDFVGIVFSAADQVRVFRFPADAGVATGLVVEFAETFLGGGTDCRTPLTAAVEELEREYDDVARARGDIVLITDDECAVTEEWTREWREAKRRLGFRLFGVAVGAPGAAGADSVLDALCDNLRRVEDLTDVHSAADLFRAI